MHKKFHILCDFICENISYPRSMCLPFPEAVPFRSILRCKTFRSVSYLTVPFRSVCSLAIYYKIRALYTHVNLWLERMPYSEYLKCRALTLHLRGLVAQAIVDILESRGFHATVQEILKFLCRVEEISTIMRKPGSKRPSSVTPQMQALVDDQMRRDDETTASQLHTLLCCH